LIDKTIEVDTGSVLDFGSRAVHIVSGGKLDTGPGNVTIRCGAFSSNGGSTPGIIARGPTPAGVIDGGTIIIEARSTCSQDSGRFCFNNRSCQFGLCDTRVCSGNNLLNCDDDDGCALGVCTPDNRCSNKTSFACNNNTDCQLGVCSDLSCSNNKSLGCSTHDDCNFGTCSGGASGDIFINRNIRADGNTAGSVSLRGAGDLTVSGLITVDSTFIEGDGGTVDLTAGMGSVLIESNIKGTGGGLSQGGEICISTGGNLTTTAEINMDGGDFDGGFIEIEAEGNVSIGKPLRANSNNGEGFGGEISALAGGNLSFPTSANHKTNGHTSGENFGGDGGTQCYSADGNITAAASVTFEATGATPDGSGDLLAFSSQGSINMASDLRAGGLGIFSSGGVIEIFADEAINIQSTSKFDTRGGAGGGGDTDIAASGDITIGGTIESTGSNLGFAGSIFIEAQDEFNLTGTLMINGSSIETLNGMIDIIACETVIGSTGIVDNRGDYGTNAISGGDAFTITGGGKVLAEPTGKNLFFYRQFEPLPKIFGTVTPAPTFIVESSAGGCITCGNGTLQIDETCDDGNTIDGDGCSADCQDEACIAGTAAPGYPAVPLCDDGNDCTIDSCSNSACSHVLDNSVCDDLIDCTIDGCNEEGACENTPNDALCEDNNQCTLNKCSTVTACTFPIHSGSCDDDIACTVNDTCHLGQCVGTADCPESLSCNLSTGMCSNSTTTTTTTTSTTTTTTSTTTTTTTMPPGSTTTTTLPQGGTCGNGVVEPPEACDDGSPEWTIGEYCDAGCNELDCGDTDNNGAISASDALFGLRTAVGLGTCTGCICDVDGTGSVTAGDALRLLRIAVGLSSGTSCPVCPS
jgi:cysteine-rich repeat protein